MSNFRSEVSVPGLMEWLSEQELLHYEEHAQRWCKEKGVGTMHELAQRCEDFCEDLSMKRLQRKRVRQILASCIFGPQDDPYMLTRCVGQGATALVYECTRGGQVFAAKVVDLTKIQLQPDYEELLNKLMQETHILFNLRHPRIVSLYDVYKTDDRLFLVMEFLEGGDLMDHVLQAGRLSEDDARCVFLQLVDALDYIHREGVVHRDLKLENILVNVKPPTGNFEVKVSDFGHSRILKDGMSTAMTKAGTPQYCAPEVALAPSGKGYGLSVDLWSLGVVLYVMLEGKFPFRGDQMADRILEGDVQFDSQSSTSPAARDLIMRLIQVDRVKRILLSGCFEHAWCRDARGAAVPHPPLGVGRPPGRRVAVT